MSNLKFRTPPYSAKLLINYYHLDNMCSTLVTIVSFLTCVGVSISLRELAHCHADFTSKPKDGTQNRYTFPWLGFIPYVHISTKLLHHSKAPRVVLIHKQFALTTAFEMTNLPRNFKLGDVVFGEYEQDESECNLSPLQLSLGQRCADAYLVIPHVAISSHPEYSRFDISNSLAIVKLLRPIKSEYMIPICLPTRAERARQKKLRTVFLVDYLSAVPSNFDIEKMAKKTSRLYLQDTCIRNISKGWTNHGLTNVLCTSGCGVRLASPIVAYTRDGRFELIGLAARSGFCENDTMREQLSSASPLYIDVFRYMSWVVNVISAYVLPYAYPHTFRVSENGTVMGGIKKRNRQNRRWQRAEWHGHIYFVGDYCFEHRNDINPEASFVYSERFQIIAKRGTKLSIVLQVSTGIECVIVCAKLKFSFIVDEVKIVGVGGYNITMVINHKIAPKAFLFDLGLEGQNTSTSAFNKWVNVTKNYTKWS